MNMATRTVVGINATVDVVAMTAKACSGGGNGQAWIKNRLPNFGKHTDVSNLS